MNKQELQNEINKTKEHLANMEKMLAECEYERWKPDEDEMYFIVDSKGSVLNLHDTSRDVPNLHFAFYNCFQTREQAEAEAEKILVRRMLEDIARRLNKGKEIDWNNSEQSIYSLCLDAKTDKIDWCRELKYKIQSVVYCLDIDFYKVAIQEIGEERLKKYLRGE